MTFKMSALAALLALCATTAVEAATFSFSFKTDAGHSFFGDVTGDVSNTDSNLIENVSVTGFGLTSADGTISYSGLEPTYANGAYSAVFAGGDLFEPGKVSFDGSVIDLLACTFICQQGFGIIQGVPNSVEFSAFSPFGNTLIDLSTWSLAETSVPAVPLPASAPLVLAGMAALAALRKRRA